jgi:hypothetical protein
MTTIWNINAPGMRILALTLSATLPATITKGIAQTFVIRF